MAEVWAAQTLSEKIIEDANCFLVALYHIIEKEGVYVEEFDAHTDHHLDT